MTSLAAYVEALDTTWRGLVSAVSGLPESRWDTPTDLDGWSVKDNVSHVIGVELLLMGEPYPTHVLPDGLAHVRNDSHRWTEVPVDLRRGLPGSVVLDELVDVVERRLKSLRALDDPALEEEHPGFFGPMKLGHLLGIRVFDCWAHEQDVRRALGLPRDLTSVAAELSRRRLLLALSGLSRLVPAAAGRVVVVETTGAQPSVATLTMGSSYVDGAVPGADVRITTDFETFMVLGTGRLAAADAAVSVAGDAALGEELLRVFAITP